MKYKEIDERTITTESDTGTFWVCEYRLPPEGSQHRFGVDMSDGSKHLNYSTCYWELTDTNIYEVLSWVEERGMAKTRIGVIGYSGNVGKATSAGETINERMIMWLEPEELE